MGHLYIVYHLRKILMEQAFMLFIILAKTHSTKDFMNKTGQVLHSQYMLARLSRVDGGKHARKLPQTNCSQG